jgi:hypothetical protein
LSQVNRYYTCPEWHIHFVSLGCIFIGGDDRLLCVWSIDKMDLLSRRRIEVTLGSKLIANTSGKVITNRCRRLQSAVASTSRVSLLPWEWQEDFSASITSVCCLYLTDVLGMIFAFLFKIIVKVNWRV